jgi:hypothetical protein
VDDEYVDIDRLATAEAVLAENNHASPGVLSESDLRDYRLDNLVPAVENDESNSAGADGGKGDVEESPRSENKYDDDDYEDDFDDYASSTKTSLPRADSLSLTAEQPKRSSLPIWLQ